MNNYEILCDMRKGLEDPDNWWDGTQTSSSNDSSCIITFLFDRKQNLSEARKVLENIAEERLDRYNDSHSHTEVLALIDKGIEHFSYENNSNKM